MIFDFIKSEPDLSDTDVLDELILRALLNLFHSYGLHQDDDCLLDPENWADVELDNFELPLESTDPLAQLSKIEAETGKVINRVNRFLIPKYVGVSKEKRKELGVSHLYSLKDLQLFNLNGDYSLICSVLALRILIPLKESLKVILDDIVIATKLIQAIPLADLLHTTSLQVIAEMIRTIDLGQINKKYNKFDEDPVNAFKKEIVQRITIEYFYKDESISDEALSKKVRATINREINKSLLTNRASNLDPNASYSIRSTTLDRWVAETKKIIVEAGD